MKKLSVFTLFLALISLPFSNALATEFEVEGLGDPGAYQFYGIMPDTAGFSSLLMVADLGSGNPVEVITLPAPFTSINSRLLAFAPRETKFISPSDVFCGSNICSVYVRSGVGGGFHFHSTLFVFDTQTGGLTSITPVEFTL